MVRQYGLLAGQFGVAVDAVWSGRIVFGIKTIAGPIEYIVGR